MSQSYSIPEILREVCDGVVELVHYRLLANDDVAHVGQVPRNVTFTPEAFPWEGKQYVFAGLEGCRFGKKAGIITDQFLWFGNIQEVDKQQEFFQRKLCYCCLEAWEINRN